MPWYNDLRPSSDENRQQHGLLFPDMSDEEKYNAILNILGLRENLDEAVAPKLADKNLIIGTWNLKEFGHLKNRLPESYFYIAEIVSRFDLVAIQEIKSTLVDLRILMKLLGSGWRYMVADITEGTDGNSERFAYIYDSKRVELSGLAGEIVLWDDITNGSAVKQLKRTPFITGFKSGWKSFAIINLHLQPGDTDEKTAKRKEEVRLLMNAIKSKMDRERFWTNNLMMMGDFNLYMQDDDIVELINEAGFVELPALIGTPTNVPETEVYDRIFFHETEYFKISKIEGGGAGGVVKFFDQVFPVDDEELYRDFMLEHKEDPSTLTSDAKFLAYYKNHWRRSQMSDHYPVWLQLETDSSEDFLQEKLAEF
jgi:endonuclease/exonuclease/phosphatase family metal-dependent hydrolase